jgi:hypothetical protein
MKLTAFFKILNPITERETKTKQDREEPRSWPETIDSVILEVPKSWEKMFH